MATIDDFLIPDDLIVEFERIIDHVSPTALKLFVTSRPDLVKGFRPSHVQVKTIRQRLKILLHAAGPLDPALSSFLAGESLDLEIVAVLSSQALVLIFIPCVSYFGWAFLAAALLDDRQAVREMAVNYLELPERDEVEKIDAHGAALILRQELEPFLKHMVRLFTAQFDDGAVSPKISENSTGAASLPPEVGEKYRKKIAHLEKQLVQGKEAIRLNKILNEKIKTKESDAKDLQQKISQERKMRSTAREEADTFHSELVELKRVVQEKIQAGVAGEVSSVVRGWLKTPQQIEIAAQSLGSGTRSDDDLLTRAEDILMRQSLVDRNSGNRKILSERLAALENVRDRVLETTGEALHPLPELRQISLDIEEEIGNLQAILGVKDHNNSPLLKMRARINQVASASELAEIQKLLFHLSQADIFTQRELSTLYDSYQDRQDQLYDQYGYPSDGLTHFNTSDANILQVTAEKRPFHLVLDGHNIILDSAGLFPDISSDKGSGAEARNWLLAIVDTMMQGSACQASVFFDSSSPSVRSYSKQVKEIFSGGGGSEVKNRADDAIVSYLASFNPEVSTHLPVIVVTNDRELQGLVQEKGAKIMPLAQFAMLTQRYHV